jgi:hypothetical protein
MMHPMPEYADDDDVEEILRSLPPAPESWVSRAEEMPQLERALAALGDGDDEPALRRALEGVGLEPDDRRLRALARLRDLRREV